MNPAIRLSLLAFALVASPLAMARAPSPAQAARLEALRKAADDLDEGADPAAYRKAWEGVLAQGAALYPAGHPMLAWLEGELVTADYLQGDIAGALARADRIAAALEAGGPEWHARRMELANAQVVILMTLARHDRARELARQVLDWRLATSGGKPSTQVSAAWSNLANAEFEFGNHDRAIALVKQAIAENNRLSPIPPNAAPHFANLPVYLLASGRLEEAIEAARGNQALFERILPANHPFQAANLNTLARILMQLGRLPEAEQVARRALDMAVARFGTSQQAVNYMTTLAQALSAQTKHTEALALSAAAADLMAKALGPDADRTLTARETHALAQANAQANAQARGAAGDRDAALAQLRAIAAIRELRLPPFHRDRIGGNDRLAAMALRLGDGATAHAAQAEAQRLRAASLPPDDIASASGEARLAAIEARTGKAGGLERALKAAAVLAQRLRRIEDSGLARSGHDREIRAGFGWALDAALSAGDTAEAFRLAQAMMESSAGRAVRAAAARAATGDPALSALLRERQDAAAELEALLDRQLRLAGRGAPAADMADLARQRDAASVRLDRARAALSAVAPALAQDNTAQGVSLAEAQAALGPDEALLIMAVGETRTGLIALTRSGTALAAADAGADRIAALVARLRAGLSPAQGIPVPFDLAASGELHALLFPAPVIALVQDRPRLLIAANGALSALPFAVLAPAAKRPTLAKARFLIRDHALVTLPSIASLRTARAPSGARRVASFLAVGAPDIGVEAAGGTAAYRSASMARQLRALPRLPATAEELKALGTALAARETRILTGPQATERALRDAGQIHADVLAFATHGLVAGEIDGLDEPALVLTPEGSDDGLLTASEIMRLRLDSDWVLLSACNTAAGSGVDGNGLAGLARAFLHAGGRNLLASHWAVRDDAAAALSTATVTAYAGGTDPAEALRLAMLAMARGKDPSPSLWAPFVYIGR